MTKNEQAMKTNPRSRRSLWVYRVLFLLAMVLVVHVCYITFQLQFSSPLNTVVLSRKKAHSPSVAIETNLNALASNSSRHAGHGPDDDRPSIELPRKMPELMSEPSSYENGAHTEHEKGRVESPRNGENFGSDLNAATAGLTLFSLLTPPTPSPESSQAAGKGLHHTGGVFAPAEDTWRSNSSFFSQCELDSMGLAKYRQWNRITICEGFSTVSCVLLPYHSPQRAFYCYVENAIELSHSHRDDYRMQWLVFCHKNEHFRAPRHSFWAEIPPHRNTLLSSDVTFFDEQPSAQLLAVLKPVQKETSETGETASTAAGMPVESDQHPSMTYVANGDCAGKGNPAHCQADGHLLWLIRNLHNVASKDTTAVLRSGFSFELVSGALTLWKMLASRIVRFRNQNANHYRTPLAKTLDEIHQLFVDAHSQSKSGASGTQDADQHAHSGEGHKLRQVSLLAFSPEPMYGPHWQSHRDDMKCQGRSPLLMDFQHSAIHYMNNQLYHDEVTRVLVAGQADRQLSVSCDDVPQFFAKLAETQPANVKLFLGGNAYDTAKPQPTGFFNHESNGLCKLITVVQRVGKRRSIANEPEIVLSLSRDFPDYLVVHTNPGGFAFVQQYALFPAATLVMGMHGGGMWNAARWMRPPQLMLEIMPVRGPGTTCRVAKLFGVHYHHIVCKSCIGNSDTGTLIPTEVATTVREMLAGEHSISDCAQV